MQRIGTIFCRPGLCRLGPVCLLAVLLLAGPPLTAPAAAELPPAPDLLGQPLDLEEAIALALKHHPQLQVYSLAAAEAGARADQAARGLNPELEFELENFAGSGAASGFGAAEYTLLLSQTFERGGKRERARDVAEREVDLIALDGTLAARQIKAQVSVAFLGVLAAQTELALDEELVDLAQQDLEFVRRQISSGAISPVETNRARLAVSEAKLAVQTASAALSARKRQLSVLWNSDEPTFGAVLGSLESLVSTPDWNALSARLPNSPQMRTWKLEAARRQAELAVAAAQGKVDITAGAGLRHSAESGDNAVVAAVSVPLSFRDRNQDGIRAAQYGLARLETERQAQHAELLGYLAHHFEQLKMSYDTVATMRGEILPLAEESRDEVNAAYRKGLFSLTDVMAARRTWFETQGAYFAALARYHEASTAIELLLGDPLENSPRTQERN